jgi:Predicted integral membrane protein
MNQNKENSLFKGNTIFLLGILLRLLLVGYSEYQDLVSNIKYTDIDYSVYTDGAYEVLQGNPPYERHTYRYTPLLAWLLTPNILLWPGFGKVMFVLTDILCAYYIKQILALTTKLSKSYVDMLSSIWIFNPVVFTVSSRGNADTLITLLVLMVLYHLAKGNITLSAIIYGLAVHFKIYPAIYALPIYFYIDHNSGQFFTKDRIKFVLISASVFILLFAIFYAIYGWQFAYETYFYHLVRKDHRHNYSVYFYYIYLNFEKVTFVESVLTFLPQIALLTLAGVKYYKDLPFCCFVQTFIFVMFNKVCTAQYFIWFFVFLPLIFARNELYISKKKRLIWVGIQWLIPELVWNTGAHFLEARGVNVFGWIWVLCVAFFISNWYAIKEIVKNQQVWIYKAVSLKNE